MQLSDRVALITGAGSGIGQGIALRFAHEGARLALVDIEAPRLEETAARLKEAHAEFECYQGDVSRAEDVERFFRQAVKRFGRLDIDVNNAGTGNPVLPVHQMPENEFDRTIAVNLRGVFLCARAAARRMIEQGGGGRIINVSSQAGKTGFPMLGPYSASKAGVILLTQVMAKELAAHKITVNAICPGTIDTPLLRGTLEPVLQATGMDLEEWALKNLPAIPLGRIGYPEDVARLVAFLASDEADYMTGQAVNITGGQEMH
jgi:meso-butanediol dehydrogenase/(S,S)-butanediol dehydrogenase/diacetyl reductase